MSEQVDHEAAKELIKKTLRIGGITDMSQVTHDDIAHANLMVDHPYTEIIKPIALAYLDLDAKLEAANERADELQSRLDTVTASHCEMLRELQAERQRSDRLAKLEKNYPLYRAYYDLCFPPKGTPASEIETLHDEFLTARDNRLAELEQENAELRARLEGRT